MVSKALGVALAALLAQSVAAEARQHHPARGHRMVATSAAPLDTFTTPTGTYSFRKVKSTYGGPAVRLRRASDNAELDIAYLGCTTFTGCPWDAAAAVSHCAATTCFGRVAFYDQSGGSLNLEQASNALQPTLVFSCNGSLPCWRFPTSSITVASAANVTPATGNATLSVVANRSTGTGACQFIRENGTTAAAQRILGTAAATTWGLFGGTSGSMARTASDAGWHTAIGIVNGASSLLRIDGTEGATASAVGSVTAGPVTITGTGSSGTNCDVSEAVVWDNYLLTLAERNVWQANQQSWHGTP